MKVCFVDFTGDLQNRSIEFTANFSFIVLFRHLRACKLDRVVVFVQSGTACTDQRFYLLLLVSEQRLEVSESFLVN